MAKIRIPHPEKPIAGLMRLIAATVKIEVTNDNPQLTDSLHPSQIWAFWHDQMFLVPWLYRHLFPQRQGTILTSPSKDGQIIADVCQQFHFTAARGSSSKPHQGRAALILMADNLAKGHDVAITPDGPRGPYHQLQPGIIKLAQLTGHSIQPLQLCYSRAITFPTWDRFQLPLPFTRLRVHLSPPQTVPRRLDEAGFEDQRLQLENTLNQVHF